MLEALLFSFRSIDSCSNDFHLLNYYTSHTLCHDDVFDSSVLRLDYSWQYMRCDERDVCIYSKQGRSQNRPLRDTTLYYLKMQSSLILLERIACNQQDRL